MSHKVEGWEKALPLVRLLKENEYFDIEEEAGQMVLKLIGDTQADVAQLRKALPPAVWHKKWLASMDWWNYEAMIDGVLVCLIGITEKPRTCTAITVKKVVKERVATAFEEREVEKDVIIGWDCGASVDE